MDCQRLQEIEEKNLYKKITEEERAEILLHIEMCEECKANYESSFLFQDKFIKSHSSNKDTSNIKGKVHLIVEKLADHSLFDFIFGFGHNPVKAGIIVGIVFLIIVLFFINVMFTHKPAKYEAFPDSKINTNYTSQFQNKK